MFIRTVKFTLHSWLLLPVIAGAAGWGGYSLGAGKRPAGKNAPTNTPESKSSAVAAPAAPDMPLVLKTRDLAVPADLSDYRPEYLECWRVIRDFSADQVKSALSQIGEVAARPSTPAVRRMLYFRWAQLEPEKAMESARALPPNQNEFSEPWNATLTAWIRKDPEAVHRYLLDRPRSGRSQIVQMIAQYVRNGEPGEVMTRAAAMDEEVLRAVALLLAKTESNDPVRRENFLKLLSSMGSQSPTSDVRNTVYTEWAATDPQGAIAAASSSPASAAGRQRTLKSILYRWAVTDPGASLRWSVEHPEVAPVDDQVESYIKWLGSKPVDAQLWLDRNRVTPAFHGTVTRKLLSQMLGIPKPSSYFIQPDKGENLKLVRDHYDRWKAAQPQETGQWLTTINSDVRRKLEGGAR